MSTFTQDMQQQPKHLAPQELLLDYALGTIDRGSGLAVAGHVWLSAEARAEVARLRAIGGVLIETAEPAALAPDALDRVLARVQGSEPEPMPARQHMAPEGFLPHPIAEILPDSIDRLAWRKVISGVEEFRITVPDTTAKLSLLRIQPGRAMPKHTHRGEEMTLVLGGTYTDRLGEFRRGDFALLDGSVEHQPVAGNNGDCICFVVSRAPLKLTGPLGRLLNPFIKF